MSYMTFSSQEKPLFQKRIPLWHLFYSVHTLSCASDKTTSQNIGGAVPHLKFWWTVHPSPPRSPPMKITDRHDDYTRSVTGMGLSIKYRRTNNIIEALHYP